MLVSAIAFRLRGKSTINDCFHIHLFLSGLKNVVVQAWTPPAARTQVSQFVCVFILPPNVTVLCFYAKSENNSKKL